MEGKFLWISTVFSAEQILQNQSQWNLTKKICLDSKFRFAQVDIFSSLWIFAWESFISKKVDNFKSFYDKSRLSFFNFQLLKGGLVALEGW